MSFFVVLGKLHVVPPDKDKDCLPSPEDLKGKILVKVCSMKLINCK